MKLHANRIECWMLVSGCWMLGLASQARLDFVSPRETSALRIEVWMLDGIGRGLRRLRPTYRARNQNGDHALPLQICNALERFWLGRCGLFIQRHKVVIEQMALRKQIPQRQRISN